MRSLPCTARRLPPEVLDRLAHSLARSASMSPSGPRLVRARDVGSGAEIASRPLPSGHHPARSLLGELLPPAWWASGVVVDANARSLGPAGGGTRSESSVTVAVLVGRDGSLSHAVEGLALADEPPNGRLVDLLRRTVALPTSAPDMPVADWWRQRWLDRVVQGAALSPGTQGGTASVAAAMEPDLLAALERRPELCSVEGWEILRRMAANAFGPGTPGDAALYRAAAGIAEPRHAGWMDAGCFARWAVSELPVIEDLLLIAAALLPDHLIESIASIARPATSGTPSPRSVVPDAIRPR